MLAQSEDKKSAFEWATDKIITIGAKQTLVAYLTLELTKTTVPLCIIHPYTIQILFPSK